MATSQNLFTTGYIAGQIKQSHEDTFKLLKFLGHKPYREVRTEKRTMRQWHKDAMYAAMSYIEEKRKAKEAPAPEPVQATLPLEPEAPLILAAEKIKGFDVTVFETKQVDALLSGINSIDARLNSIENERPVAKLPDEMLSILRSIDQRLYELTVLWSK